MKGGFLLPYLESDNVWMVCSNCENNFSIEELFSEDDEQTSIECPVCYSHSFRKCDSYGQDIENDYKEELNRFNNYDNLDGWY